LHSYFVVSEFSSFFQGLLDMDRFVIKKRKLDDDNESGEAGTSSGSITHSAVSVSSKTVMCLIAIAPRSFLKAVNVNEV
jgi:hypothetical protein